MVSRQSDRAAATRLQFVHPIRRTMSKKRTNAVEARDASSHIEGMGREDPIDAPVALCVTAANRGSTVLFP